MTNVFLRRGKQAFDRPARLRLTQTDLADRWRLSPRTLERWRWLKLGPAYLKIGGRVVYRIEDVEAYEAAQFHAGGGH